MVPVLPCNKIPKINSMQKVDKLDTPLWQTGTTEAEFYPDVSATPARPPEDTNSLVKFYVTLVHAQGNRTGQNTTCTRTV